MACEQKWGERYYACFQAAPHLRKITSRAETLL
jgi:hypothetical protein